MFPRIPVLPQKSFFLFGPRGTGKTTWLKVHLESAEWFNLLRSKEYQGLVRDPELFRQRVTALPGRSWIVVDEIQKLPSLLDEVHAIMNDLPGKYNFALTGSSAHKLKRTGVNLLAGRAINRKFFPLVYQEIKNTFDCDLALTYGMLPAVVTASSKTDKVEVLEAYLENYLKEEVLQEAAVKRLEPFIRFFEVAAILNGQTVNFSNIASDSGVGRTTVQGYFSVLEQTLLGTFLPSWRPKAKVKEVEHPKFYFFDAGVARVAAHRAHLPVTDQERGYLLETLILGELRAWNEYFGFRADISYWGTPSESEIDFIVSRGNQKIGIEVKASDRWKKGFGKVLKDFQRNNLVNRAFGVYLGNKPLQDENLTVLPLPIFLEKLSTKQIIGFGQGTF